MKAYVGCSGWSYSSWDGHFYPKGTEPKEYLPYYANVFDFVEIDSTFYRMPYRFMGIRWSKITPDDFRFAAKFPRSITHENRLVAPADELEYFFDSMRPLKNKLLAFLIQLPPSLTMKEGLEKLKNLIGRLDADFRYALEVCHESWFSKEVYRILSNNNICLAWSQLDTIHTPPEVTTDFVYLRLIGDRSIDEKDFGLLQRDRTKEMATWASRVKLAEKKLKFSIVAANNHYAGFGPATANGFRKMIGLDEAAYEEKKQSTLD